MSAPLIPLGSHVNECPGDGKDIRESLLTVESPSSTVFPRFKKSTASWQLTKEV